MKRFHINPKGEILPCSAKEGNCRFGDVTHYSTEAEAQKAYDSTMAAFVLPTLNSSISKRTLLETIHGSHLYGLATPTSDIDTYRVIMREESEHRYGGPQKKMKTKQKIVGDDDVLETELTSFLLKADEGVPQALEAMFSRLAPAGPLDSFRHSFYLNTPAFAKTYRRTIMNFARLGIEDDEAREVLAPDEDEMDKERVAESVKAKKPRRVERNGMEKYRRHALRLLLNREEGIELGRFNPTLTADQKDYVYGNTALGDMDYAKLIKSRVM